MTLKEKIENIFPRAADIPGKLLNDIPFIQKEYLVNGEIHAWEGPRQEVLSPVRVAAYDHGQGVWPTMSVAERIGHMERFIFRMIKEKERVVRFLMWEIGKSLENSKKEFDRTIQYMNDTLAALKDLDRAVR